MKKYWNTLLSLVFIALYLTPALELDTEEYKANYSNESHQYVSQQEEQSSIATREIKQTVEQEFDLLFLSALSLEITTSSFIFFSDEPTLARKIFLLNSILII